MASLHAAAMPAASCSSVGRNGAGAWAARQGAAGGRPVGRTPLRSRRSTYRATESAAAGGPLAAAAAAAACRPLSLLSCCCRHALLITLDVAPGPFTYSLCSLAFTCRDRCGGMAGRCVPLPATRAAAGGGTDRRSAHRAAAGIWQLHSGLRGAIRRRGGGRGCRPAGGAGAGVYCRGLCLL